MLTNNYLLSSLSSLKDFVSPSTQILQGNGYDGVIDILQNMRGVTYPCVILESGGSGSVQVVEGPVDTYTQSLWVMGNLGRGEDEDALFRAMKALTMKVFAKLLQDRREGTHPEVQELDLDCHILSNFLNNCHHLKNHYNYYCWSYNVADYFDYM